MTAAAVTPDTRPGPAAPGPVIATQLLVGRALWRIADVVDAIALAIADAGELLNRGGHRAFSAGCDRYERTGARR